MYGCFGIVAKTEFGHLLKGRFSVFQKNHRAARANDGIGLLIRTELPASGDMKPVGHFLTGTLQTKFQPCEGVESKSFSKPPSSSALSFCDTLHTWYTVSTALDGILQMSTFGDWSYTPDWVTGASLVPAGCALNCSTPNG